MASGGEYSQQHYTNDGQYRDYVGECDASASVPTTPVTVGHYSYRSNEPCANDTSIVVQRNGNKQPQINQTILADETQVQPSRKKSTTSKNYIGKQNLFQEFLNQDVAKIRDTENRYIIGLI